MLSKLDAIEFMYNALQKLCLVHLFFVCTVSVYAVYNRCVVAKRKHTNTKSAATIQNNECLCTHTKMAAIC